MVRGWVPLLFGGLLAGCVSAGGGGSSDWAGNDPGGIRWSGPYGGPGVMADPFWRGRSYGYRPDPFYDGGSRRTFRPSRNVVCDRATSTCYRRGEIDASETRDYFGGRAGRRVDRIRDAAGTNKVFRADDDVVCNRRQRVCFKDGHPDRSETRDFFGKKAARRLD